MSRPLSRLLLLCLCLPAVSPSLAQAPRVEEVLVTARLREERLLEVPAAVSVLSGERLSSAGTVNTQQLSTLVPTLYYNSANPRNTAYTLRGLGSNTLSISAANDGMEPGVGFYVDGVYHGRPATAAFDFTDIARVEVLRGPQGTLFGKNTTGGAIQILSQPPSPTPQVQGELQVGTDGYTQWRGSLSGPLSAQVAGRLAVQSTRRDGVIRQVTTGARLNALDNLALRGQLLFTPDARFSARVIADYARVGAACCTQIFLRTGDSKRSSARQFEALAAGLGYSPASRDIYDRLSDVDAPVQVDTQEGGVSLHLNREFQKFTLVSISAWRFWQWDVDNDRDYTGLPIQTVQRIPSRQDQVSQELRILTDARQRWRLLAGVYAFAQRIRGTPTSVYGPDATAWLLDAEAYPVPLPSDLLDGYGQRGRSRFAMQSGAAFGELSVDVTDSLTATLGLRYTHEDKQGRYATEVGGGLDLTGRPDAAVLARAKAAIFQAQSYAAHDRQGNVSGRANLAWSPTERLMVYAAYAHGYKSGGLNMSGLPRNARGEPVLATAVIDDERNRTLELGIKHPVAQGRGSVALAAFHTVVDDYQTNIVSSIETAALRSYPANIPQVRVQGVEADLHLPLGEGGMLFSALAYAHGQTRDYPAGPCPLETQTSSTTACDLSGMPLPGLSRWVGSVGVDWRYPLTTLEAFWHLEASARSAYNSSPEGSRYARIAGYAHADASVGLRGATGWELALFARNLTGRDYVTALSFQTGNSGLVMGQPSDPRLVGLRLSWRHE